MSENTATTAETAVPFSGRLVSSASFSGLFQEGMALVEESAAYLDGDGKTDARRLSRPAAAAYATESMRLTTRLMQLASWLLLHRAVNAGEMTRDQARLEKERVRLDLAVPGPDDAALALLPQRLAELAMHSMRLQARIIHLEEGLYAEAPVQADNDILRQHEMLRRAFALHA